MSQKQQTIQSVLPVTASSANMRQNTERRADAGRKESREMISTIVYCDVLTFAMTEGPDIVDISVELNSLAGRSGVREGVLNAYGKWCPWVLPRGVFKVSFQMDRFRGAQNTP